MAEKLVYLNPTEPFNLYLKVAALAGLFVASPFVLYQVWMFISPGLYRNEKRYVLPFMVLDRHLFLAGGAFAYKMVYPAGAEFPDRFGNQFQPMITIGEYTDLFLTIIIGMGVIFEMPILVFFLALMGIVNAGWMWRNLRYSILVIFIIAAIMTPTTDILNMCIFAAPMVGLYVFSIGIACWCIRNSVRPARREKTNDEESPCRCGTVALGCPPSAFGSVSPRRLYAACRSCTSSAELCSAGQPRRLPTGRQCLSI